MEKAYTWAKIKINKNKRERETIHEPKIHTMENIATRESEFFPCWYPFGINWHWRSIFFSVFFSLYHFVYGIVLAVDENSTIVINRCYIEW